MANKRQSAAVAREPDPETEPDYADEYPVLPEGACCARCVFSELTRPDPTSIQRQRICRRAPPVVVLSPAQLANGQRTVGLQPMFPPVGEDAAWWCWEFTERAGPEVEPATLTAGDA